jgi:hypothetical protein
MCCTSNVSVALCLKAGPDQNPYSSTSIRASPSCLIIIPSKLKKSLFDYGDGDGVEKGGEVGESYRDGGGCQLGVDVCDVALYLVWLGESNVESAGMLPVVSVGDSGAQEGQSAGGSGEFDGSPLTSHLLSRQETLGSMKGCGPLAAVSMTRSLLISLLVFR